MYDLARTFGYGCSSLFRSESSLNRCLGHVDCQRAAAFLTRGLAASKRTSKLESLLQTRGGYDTRAHVVSGLELLADELVTLGNGSETAVVLTKRLQSCSDTTTEGCRTLSMGLHVLKEMLDKRPEYVPTHKELLQLTSMAGRCLESADSGVRMDAVKFCVALHARVGEAAFWEAMADIKDDPKSLITYYIVKKQREDSIAA